MLEMNETVALGTQNSSQYLLETSHSNSKYSIILALVVAMMTSIYQWLAHQQKTTDSPRYARRVGYRGMDLTEALQDMYPTPRPRSKGKQRIGSVSRSSEKELSSGQKHDGGTGLQDQLLHLDKLHNVELCNKYI